MPMCWALLRRLFHLRAFNSSPSQSRNHNDEMYTFGANRVDKGKKGKDGRRTSWWDQQTNLDMEFRDVELQKSETEERTIDPEKGKIASLQIWQSREVDVTNDRKSALGLVGTNNTEEAGFRTKTVVDIKARQSESSGGSSN
ncbi:hypothetical protein B7494_g5333 [Chlorociboria aeruginascens]|nr:hypothetical protein B7494_g5333 [Chlorociboria aeruginascens]